MKEEALKNLENISLEQVKNFIKEKNPVYYDKMIISSSEIVNRADFYFINYSGEFLHRESKVVEFPLYGSVKDNFDSFKGGVQKHGQKCEITSSHIFNTLSNTYQIIPSKDFDANSSELEYPISESNGMVNSNQPSYFIPERTKSWSCETCNGQKYIRCMDHVCNGRHEWDCTGCGAKGVITCSKCAGKGSLDCSTCNGSNKVRCSNCGGDGKVNDGGLAKIARSAQDGRQKDKFFQEKTCGSCSGKGMKMCSNCNKGKVTCSRCNASGKVTCSECEGFRKITCKKCYGDRERYGKVDCTECKAMGEVAKISFVTTTVGEKSVSRIFFRNNNLKKVDSQTLMKYAKKSIAQVNILKNFNSTYEQKYDDLVSDFLHKIQVELGFQTKGFENRVTSEELYFQVIPCVQIEYRHMITNTIHTATILNFFENPELIIENEVENEKSNAKDKFKVIGNFFGKLFKTKAYKEKEDKKREIKLMIMLAKVDGKIEEEEKLFLSSQISGLSEFSVTEKLEFFNLMDAAKLPDLSKNEVVFFNEEKYNETISKLESLAAKDGEVEASESAFIENIKALKDQFTTKKK